MLGLEVTQITSAFTLCRTSQKGPGDTTLPCAQELERQADITLIGLPWRLKGLMSIKHLAPCHKHVFAPAAAVIIIIIIMINEFIFLEAIIKSPFRLLLTELYLANCVFHGGCFAVLL